MTPPPAPTTPPAPASPSTSGSIDAGTSAAQPPRRASGRVPDWLQLLVIGALFGSAIYVLVDGHALWSAFLAIGGLAFGASFALRRMVGDEYGRA